MGNRRRPRGGPPPLSRGTAADEAFRRGLPLHSPGGLQLQILCPVPDLPSRLAPATLAPPNPARSARFRPQHLHLVGHHGPRLCQLITGCPSRQSHSHWLKDGRACKSGRARRRADWLALAERSPSAWALIGPAPADDGDAGRVFGLSARPAALRGSSRTGSGQGSLCSAFGPRALGSGGHKPFAGARGPSRGTSSKARASSAVGGRGGPVS